MLLLWWMTLIAQPSFSGTLPEIRDVVTDSRGFQEAWVRIPNPQTPKDSKELPLELTVPFCNSKSVHKLDQYCATQNGSIMIVTGIRGKIISVQPVDLSTEKSFEIFASKMRVTSSSRMPASAPEKEIVCEASCPQMDFTNPCSASAATKEKAYQELQTVMTEKADTDCKRCNLKAVVCDGKLYQAHNEIR